jgi:hypothetical protein
MKHLVERLGSSATRATWENAFKEYDLELLERILASGWSHVEGAEPGEASSIVQSILGSYLGAGTEGMNPAEAQELIKATPPLPQIGASFSNLDVQRDTTAYEALHMYIHGLALLTEALIDGFGKQGELIAYDVLSSGRASMGQRMGGSVADFMREFDEELKKSGIYAAGLDVETVAATPTENVRRVKHCEWARYFKERHPTVGYLVACSADEAFGRGYNKDLRMQRKSTIMEGGSECDFRWYSVEETDDGVDKGGAPYRHSVRGSSSR